MKVIDKETGKKIPKHVYIKQNNIKIQNAVKNKEYDKVIELMDEVDNIGLNNALNELDFNDNFELAIKLLDKGANFHYKDQFGGNYTELKAITSAFKYLINNHLKK